MILIFKLFGFYYWGVYRNSLSRYNWHTIKEAVSWKLGRS